MILVIGEILIDLIGEDNNDGIDLTARLGGAPFNVASNLSFLDVPTTFYGVVGEDIFGEYILKEAKKSYKLNLNIIKVKERNTTLATYIKDDNSSEGTFEFIKKNGSDYYFTKNDLSKINLSKVNLIHFGSLFLSDEFARNNIFNFIDEAKSNKEIIFSFNVNYREDIFKGEDDYKNIYLKMIEKMDIVKFTKDEILLLSNKSTLEEALDYFSYLKLIIVTMGKDGSLAYYKGKSLFMEALKNIKVVDSIGAGDSFYSGVISSLYSKDINNLSDEDLLKALKLGSVCASKTLMQKGATFAYKSKEDLSL